MRARRRRSTTASELAEIGVCEQRVVLQSQYGPRHSAPSRSALERGVEAHNEFLEHARRLQARGNEADRRCFIATTVYGEGFETQALRTLRDQVLLRCRVGVWVIRLYYRVGPAIARYVAKSNCRRAIARIVLKPFVALAALMLLWSDRGE